VCEHEHPRYRDSQFPKEELMNMRIALLVAVAAAVTVASVAAAGPGAAKQRVSIAIKGDTGPNGTFVLTPLQTGALKRDAGEADVAITGPRVVVVDGQKIEKFASTWSFRGRRGILTTRERLDWIDTGDAFIGVGTWKVVRGTGEYAGITGHGRSAHVGQNHGNGAWIIRHDGLVTFP
jgi:hypothetical protein